MRLSRTRLWTQARWQTPARPCSPAGGGLRAAGSQTGSFLCLGSRPAGPATAGCVAGCTLQRRRGADPCGSASGPFPGGARFRSAVWSGQRGDAETAPLTRLDMAATGHPAEPRLRRKACSERVGHLRLPGSRRRHGTLGGLEPVHAPRTGACAVVPKPASRGNVGLLPASPTKPSRDDGPALDLRGAGRPRRLLILPS